MLLTIRNLLALAFTCTAALPLTGCDSDDFDALDEVALRDGDLTNEPAGGDPLPPTRGPTDLAADADDDTRPPTRGPTDLAADADDDTRPPTRGPTDLAGGTDDGCDPPDPGLDIASGPDAEPTRDISRGPGDIAGPPLACDPDAQDCPTGHTCMLVADPETEQVAPTCVALEATGDLTIQG